MSRTNSVLYTTTIPTGQWWRIIYAFASWNTDATVKNRLNILKFQVSNGAGGSNVTDFAAPVVQTASSSGLYYLGIQGQSFSVAETTSLLYAYASLPDIVWPQRTSISMLLENGTGADIAPSPPFLAAEIYTENTDGTLTPVVSPTPLVT